MTERDFAYWLQGFFELNEAGNESHPYHLNASAQKCIKQHLELARIGNGNSFLLQVIENFLNSDGLVLVKILAAYFEAVLDPQHSNFSAAKKAHGGGFERLC